MVSPSHRQLWQIPLRSLITFCRSYPNECDVLATPTSGGRKVSQWLRSDAALANVVIRACTH